MYGFTGNNPIDRFDPLGDTFLGQDYLGWKLFNNWMKPGIGKTQSPVELSWNDFDPDGSTQNALAKSWGLQNRSALVALCASSSEGYSTPSFSGSSVSGNFINVVTHWIGLYKGSASQDSSGTTIVAKQSCPCKCEISVTLELRAWDRSDFNPGQHINKYLDDNQFIWIRDHTPFGQDFDISATRTQKVKFSVPCK